MLLLTSNAVALCCDTASYYKIASHCQTLSLTEEPNAASWSARAALGCVCMDPEECTYLLVVLLVNVKIPFTGIFPRDRV